MTKLYIPTPLRPFTGGQSVLEGEGATLQELLEAVLAQHPGLRPQLFDEGGQLRRFVNLFVNGEDMRLHDGLGTRIESRDTVEILPAIAGGDESFPSFAEWRSVLQSMVRQAEPSDLAEGGSVPPGATVVDVRTAEEWAQGHIPGAVHVDRGFLEQRIESLVADRSKPILCYCQSGTRSLFAARSLEMLGYRNVASLSGGIQQWKAEGRPIVLPKMLDEAARRRYLRHLAIAEVGPEGQQRLLDSRVLVIGAGGLGCPSSLYLAAAGVGTLGIVDNDTVDESNLQRQVLHRQAAVGDLKALSASRTLLDLNPSITINTYTERLDEAAAEALFPEYDLIVDGSDNFTTRYIINDVAVRHGKPVVHGSVYRFEGQVSVFSARHGPCYRCLYPEAPPPELAPSCAEAGVLGVLPGVIGLLQATETLKWIIGCGEPLLGRALRFDALAGQFRELRFAKDPECAVCGGAEPSGAEPEARVPATEGAA